MTIETTCTYSSQIKTSKGTFSPQFCDLPSEIIDKIFRTPACKELSITQKQFLPWGLKVAKESLSEIFGIITKFFSEIHTLTPIIGNEGVEALYAIKLEELFNTLPKIQTFRELEWQAIQVSFLFKKEFSYLSATKDQPPFDFSNLYALIKDRPASLYFMHMFDVKRAELVLKNLVRKGNTELAVDLLRIYDTRVGETLKTSAIRKRDRLLLVLASEILMQEPDSELLDKLFQLVKRDASPYVIKQYFGELCNKRLYEVAKTFASKMEDKGLDKYIEISENPWQFCDNLSQSEDHDGIAKIGSHGIYFLLQNLERSCTELIGETFKKFADATIQVLQVKINEGGTKHTMEQYKSLNTLTSKSFLDVIRLQLIRFHGGKEEVQRSFDSFVSFYQHLKLSQ